MKTLERAPSTKKSTELRKRDFHLPFSNLRREMNRLFDDFFHADESWNPKWPQFEADFQAHVDIRDNDDEIVVNAELPGVKLEDVEVTVNSDYLRIHGEKKEEKEKKEKGQYRLERSYGSFTRQLPLPCEIETEQVEATFKDGVLRIVLPKCKESLQTQRQVTVRKA
ncbi:MAG: Hsp20/alpha crystallin family protein [Candidatus Obscuribacterales bacterium]|nr:Hsp20/alpha crystallin family protein [Candidatus Obscuribacterales bacterium]